MVTDENQGGAPNYYPNSFGGPEPLQRAQTLDPPYKIAGDIYRFDSGDEDNFSQPAIFWNHVLDEDARIRLVQNIADHLSNAFDFIQKRTVANFTKVNSDFGRLLNHVLETKRSDKVSRVRH